MGIQTATRAISRRHRSAPARETRYDRRMADIISHAANVFCDKGYEGASMRDLSRATGMSLAGLYYYFESKERLLYLIQKHTFRTIVEQLKARLDNASDTEERVRIFILNHLEYFLANQAAMKVLSHEAEVMMNWIYTWHNPRVDADAASTAAQMGDIFLRGVTANGKNRK